MLRPHVHAFREVGVQVVKRPVLEVDRRAAPLDRPREPAVAIVRAVRPALVVLLAARRRRVGVEEHGREARSVQRARRPAVDALEPAHAGEIKQGRHHVGHVHELPPDRARVTDPRRPRRDERYSPPARTGVGLERRKRRVRHLAPPGRIQRRAARAAEVVRVRPLALDRRRRQAHVAAVVVEHPGGTAGIGAAVVRREDDDGVVELADRLEKRDQPSDVPVHAIEHRRIRFHVAGEQRPIGRVGGIPARRPRVGRRESRSLRNQPHLELPLPARLAHRRPARVVATTLLREVVRLRLQRRMHRVVRDVEQERLRRRRSAQCLHVLDAALGPVVSRVVVARVLVDRHELVSQHQLRGEKEVGLALHEAVERVEPALRRPVVLRTGWHAIRRRRVVPLPGHDGLVAAGAQRFGERRGVERELARIAGIPGVVVGEPAGPDRVRVHAGEKRRAGGRAKRVRRVMRETQATRGERIDVRRLDLGTEAAGIGPAHVVHVDDDDVRRALQRTRFASDTKASTPRACGRSFPGSRSSQPRSLRTEYAIRARVATHHRADCQSAGASHQRACSRARNCANSSGAVPAISAPYATSFSLTSGALSAADAA